MRQLGEPLLRPRANTGKLLQDVVFSVIKNRHFTAGMTKGDFISRLGAALRHDGSTEE